MAKVLRTERKRASNLRSSFKISSTNNLNATKQLTKTIYTHIVINHKINGLRYLESSQHWAWARAKPHRTDSSAKIYRGPGGKERRGRLCFLLTLRFWHGDSSTYPRDASQTLCALRRRQNFRRTWTPSHSIHKAAVLPHLHLGADSKNPYSTNDN